MDNIGKVVIIFSLLGICILYGISLTSFVEPPYVPLEEVAVGTHEGAVIRTKGVITDFSVTESGNPQMKMEGNKTELLIFIDSTNARKEQLNLSYGDEIEVQGRLQLYRGRYELVAAEKSIKKLTHESTISFVSQIAMYPEEYEGRRISVVGYAEDIYKHVFYLGDEKGKYLMRVKVETEARTKVNKGSIPISEVQKGDKIIVEGVFVYNPENMRYELNLISLMRC